MASHVDVIQWKVREYKMKGSRTSSSRRQAGVVPVVVLVVQEPRRTRKNRYRGQGREKVQLINE